MTPAAIQAAELRAMSGSLVEIIEKVRGPEAKLFLGSCALAMDRAAKLLDILGIQNYDIGRCPRCNGTKKVRVAWDVRRMALRGRAHPLEEVSSRFCGRALQAVPCPDCAQVPA